MAMASVLTIVAVATTPHEMRCSCLPRWRRGKVCSVSAVVEFSLIAGRKSAIVAFCHCGSVSEGNGDLRRGQTLAMVSSTNLCPNFAGGQGESGGVAGDETIYVIVVRSVGKKNRFASTITASADRFIEKKIVLTGTFAECFGSFNVRL